jgi:hypothetical protein
MLHVAPSSFEVIQLQTDPGGPMYAALRAEFPRLEALVTLLQERRREPEAAYGQRYQLEIIEHGTFAIPSLTTDTTSHAVASLLLTDKCVFYAFDNDPDLILGACLLAEGFPLAAIVIPSKRVMVNLDDPVWGMGVAHLRALHDLSVQYPIDRAPRPDPRRVTVVTGEPNFAHHIWNQLSAFDGLAATPAGAAPLDILATHEPLGPLRELFPEAAAWSVAYCPDSYLEGRNGADRMFVPLGSFRLSRRVQNRVQRFARSHLGGDAGVVVERIARTRRPMFWLSIRTRNRTAVNQIDGLIAIGRGLLAAFPRACIVLDGHSLPADFETNPSYDRPRTLEIVQADRAVAAEVIERLQEQGVVGTGQDVVPLIGCSILDSIGVASLADAYFCHHGTVQHKIGWLTDVPGIVHCNRRTLALHPARWVGAKVENGVEPRYLDEAFVEDEPPATELSQVDSSLRIERYMFTDVERMADAFVAFARSVVGVPPDQRLNGERTAMRPADSAEVSMASDFEHADRLALQRELLSIRNELFQARKTKDAITEELVGLAGRLELAKHAANTAAEDAAGVRDELARAAAQHDELRREIAALGAQLAEQSAELARRNAVARRLNDELVRRDVELLDLRAELHASQRESSVLRGELDGRAVTVEQLLTVLGQLQAARVQPAASPPPRPGLVRRVGRRVRRLLRSTRALLVARTGAR